MYTEKLINPKNFISQPIGKLEYEMTKMKAEYAELLKEKEIFTLVGDNVGLQGLLKKVNYLELNYESLVIAIRRHLNSLMIVSPFWITTQN